MSATMYVSPNVAAMKMAVNASSPYAIHLQQRIGQGSNGVNGAPSTFPSGQAPTSSAAPSFAMESKGSWVQGAHLRCLSRFSVLMTSSMKVTSSSASITPSCTRTRRRSCVDCLLLSLNWLQRKDLAP